MPIAQPTYGFAYAQPQPSRQGSYPRKPRISVTPGTGRQTREQNKSNVTFVTIGILAVIALVVAAVCSIAAITLSSATIVTMEQGDTLSSEIEEARSQGTELEVAQATLSSPSTLKAKATELGMAKASDIETIVLDEDVVKTDEQGNLSLSKSVQTATRI